MRTMRYATDRKERTHEQILSTAAELFRRDGVVATGVAGLMKEVGLTQGGFYAHFESKEALVREAVGRASLDVAGAMEQIAHAAGGGTAGLSAVIDRYLSRRHLELAERGCVLAAVGGELAREPEATREAVREGIHRLSAVIEAGLPAGTRHRARVARSVFALMVGTMQMARLCGDPEDGVAVLEEGKAAARALSGIGG